MQLCLTETPCNISHTKVKQHIIVHHYFVHQFELHHFALSIALDDEHYAFNTLNII